MTQVVRITMSLLAAGLLASLAILLSHDALAAGTTRVSVATGGAQGTGTSYNAATTPDGRFITFISNSPFDPADSGTSLDIYVRDTVSGVTTLVSRASGSGGAIGNGTSQTPSISADGRYIAFASTATNLDPADTDGALGVFLRDTVAQTTVLVSRASGVSGANGNGASSSPSLSADGGFVAFESLATNLDPADTGSGADVYRRAIASSTTIVVSRATGASGAIGNGSSQAPSISGNGRYVAFHSVANNLHPNDATTLQDVFVRDVPFSGTELVSRATGVSGAVGNGSSRIPSISSDGRHVAFESTSTNFESADTDAGKDIYVRDRQIDRTKLVSRESGVDGARGDAASQYPSISPDGRFIAFESFATNLAPGDNGDYIDVFARDLDTSVTTVASLTPGGVYADGDSFKPRIIQDGTLFFHTIAADLVPGDTNSTTDVFRVDDLDRDGMMNGYEASNPCLSPVSHDAGSDADYDGLVNGAELALSTNPCQADTDFDMRLDGADECPVTGEDLDGYEDENGCPDVDNDVDGICDEGHSATSCTGSDLGRYTWERLEGDYLDCRNVAEDYDGFHDDDGCPEPDNDYDNFPDSADDCPAMDSTVGDDGVADTGDEPTFYLTPYQSREDFDGVLDWDGCHDSPDDDYDGDGLGDETEVFTLATDPVNPDTDGDAVVDGTDNCPSWANPAQANPAWTIPAGDADCDGFTRAREEHTGTVVTQRCPQSTTPNDEAQDAWPPDFNDSRVTNLSDVVLFGSVYNQPSGADPAKKRFDLNANGSVNLSDVVLVGPFYNRSCG